MNKLLTTVGLAMSLAMVSMLAGCQLYFGDHSASGSGGAGGTGAGGTDLPPGFQCSGDKQCAAGCFCSSGVCTEGGFCAADKDCGKGFHCDTTRSSCIPDTAPAGLCVAAVTCTTAAPACATGQVPLIKDGCYTGACQAIATCEAKPTCSAIQHEADCLTRSADCSTVYNGHGCHKPDGSACKAGDTNCTCTSFTFGSCEVKGAAATIVNFAD